MGQQYLGHFDRNPNSGQGGSAFGWGWSILPYVDAAPLFNQFNASQQLAETQPTTPGGTVSNVQLAQTVLPWFSCPSDAKPERQNDGAIPNSATSSYQAASGSYNGHDGSAPGAGTNRLRWNGPFGRSNQPSTRMRDLVDGTTNQFLVAETSWNMTVNNNNRSRWYGAQDQNGLMGAVGGTNALVVNGEWAMNWTELQGNPQPHRTAGSAHTGGAHFVLGDGSVRFISENIHHTSTAWVNNANAFDRPNNGLNHGLYQRLFSIADGYVLGEF